MGYFDIVSALLHAGAAVDFPDLVGVCFYCLFLNVSSYLFFQMGWSPLMWAVYKNHLDCVEVLLSHKAHVNIIDEEDGLTPLIIACARGFSEIVKQLLQHGAQVAKTDWLTLHFFALCVGERFRRDLRIFSKSV